MGVILIHLLSWCRGEGLCALGRVALDGVELTQQHGPHLVQFGAAALAEAGGLNGDAGDPGDAGGKFGGVLLLVQESGQGQP
jgi:hypothetical protein